MRAIGFRADKSTVHFVVLDGAPESPTIFEDGKIEIGEKKNLCQEFVLLRTEVSNLISRLKPARVGMKLTDNPQSLTNMQSWFARARVEGVLMLVAGECALDLKFGLAGTIKAGIGTKKNLKEYADQGEVRGVDLNVRGRKSSEYRDAFFAALSAMGG